MLDFNGQAATVLMTLGRLDENAKHTDIRLDRIENKVDYTVQEIAVMKSKSRPVPHVEKYAKRVLTYGIPALTLYLNGSPHEAIQLLRMVLGVEH